MPGRHANSQSPNSSVNDKLEHVFSGGGGGDGGRVLVRVAAVQMVAVRGVRCVAAAVYRRVRSRLCSREAATDAHQDGHLYSADTPSRQPELIRAEREPTGPHPENRPRRAGTKQNNTEIAPLSVSVANNGLCTYDFVVWTKSYVQNY